MFTSPHQAFNYLLKGDNRRINDMYFTWIVCFLLIVSASCINQVIEMDYWKHMAIIGFVMMVVFIIGFLGILYLYIVN
uniref:DUF3953 domain-containing protein n=1 Tax=Strongyloides venezuelensis TaxID=75913 RepID=A0A0K0G626_STRVS